MPDDLMPQALADVRATVGTLRGERATTVADLARQSQAVRSNLAEAATRAAAGDADGAAAARARADVAREASRVASDRLAAFDRDAIAAIGGLAALDPCDAEADVPLVLLPVRLETRFTAGQDGLMVRIYPDDVHVDALDEGLDDDEAGAATAYWDTIWAGGPESEPDAWRALVHAAHDRAPWLAWAMRPRNLDARPEPGAAGEPPAPDYPDVTPRRRGPAVARALPDRFVVVAVQGGVNRSAIGNAIPPELPVSLARGDGSTELVVTEGLDLPIGAGMEWLVDFGAASDAGMAVTVPLAQAGVRVDRVLAFGVRGSLDPDAGGQELEALLTAHRFATGAAFLPQGTPTNNTESDRAAWQRHPDPEPPATRLAAAPPAADANLPRLASALGVEGTMLAEIAAASDREAGRARAMNTCLWQPTWNAFLDRIYVSGRLGTSVPDWVREQARDFYQDFVHGRGPLASLRVGDQPYGVLPVSAVDRRWVADGGDPIEGGIVTLLHHARDMWRAAAADIPRVGDARPIDDTLLEILGSSPVSLGVRVRSVASETTQSLMLPYLPGITNDNAQFQQLLDQLAWTVLGFQPGEVGLRGALGTTTKPLGLPFVHDSDIAFMKALAAGQAHPGKIQSILQALLEVANGMEVAAVRDATPHDQVGELVNRAAELLPDEGIRQRLVEAAGPAAEGRLSAAQLAPFVDHLDLAVEPAGPALLAYLQPVASVRGSLAEASRQPDLEPAIAVRLAAQAVGAYFRGSARLAAFRDALVELTTTTLDERRILLAETLDCASHRLDAWVTGVAARRLDAIRSRRPRGALIGAYGWVEDVEPAGVTTPDGGYIHAPSLAHAATAGILRNAYLTHNPDSAAAGAFAVDLSSARVRDALDVIDGVRQGQPLGALLGYRLERRFHELGLDRFILSVRTLAPLVAGQLTGRGEGLPADAQESIAANSVVDGIKLLEIRQDDLLAKLAAAPADNPYLLPGSWQGPHDDEPAQIAGALDELRRTLDATSDLLLAEGVHQLVGGNLARAAAALDAASAGDAPPVEADVVRTPQRGIAITHRDLLLLPEDAPSVAGWNAAAPRAAAEPRLEAWAEAQLGPASSILVGFAADGSRLTLDAAGLSALDIVYDAPDRAVLERRLGPAIPGLDVAGLWAEPAPDPGPGSRGIAETAILATTLQRLLAGARPVLRAAFARPADRPARRLVDGELTSLRGRLSAALTALGAAADDFETVAAEDAPDAAALGAARAGLEAYGVGVPQAPGETGRALARAAVAEARRRVEVGGRRLTDFDTAVAAAAASAAAAAAETDPDRKPAAVEAAEAAADTAALAASAVAKALFGDAFWMLPLVEPGATPDLFDAALVAAPPGAGGAPNGVYPGNAALRRFVRDVAGVREGVARHAEALLFGDALGRRRTLGLVQLAPAGTPGAGRWIGLPFDLDEPSPDVPVASVLIDAEIAPGAGERHAGLVLDEWIETAPRRIERRAERASPEQIREANVTTGLAVNANAPGARPPQAILLAVSPDGRRWTTDALRDTLEETIELAKLRAVTLERSVLAGRVLPALQEQSWSLQGDPALDLDALVRVGDAARMIAFVRDDAHG